MPRHSGGQTNYYYLTSILNYFGIGTRIRESMRLILQLTCVLATSLLVNFANAQTLNDTLIAEDPIKLAEEARKDGDIVRGAILFHQGNINCAKCHRPATEKDRIGPDLSLMDPTTTDQQIIESILQPSKVIKKGFETVSVITVDGQPFNGTVVRDNAQEIVLRDNQNVDRLITIRKEDLDDMRPGKKSSMPDALANELKNRQQFLDLLRYVIDIKERGPDKNGDAANEQRIARRELSPELSGLLLIKELNCVACHQSKETEPFAAAKQAPNLKWSGKQLNPAHLAEFIANPNKVKPGTTMPQMLGQLNEEFRSQSAKAITHYLVSISGNEFQPELTDGEAAHRGRELFHSVGCVACHAPRDNAALEQPIEDSTPLGDLNPKYNLTALTAFLENPHDVRPSGRMPNMQLTHHEAQEISNYLLQADDPPVVPWKTDAALAKKGEFLFSALNCARCHTDLKGNAPNPPSEVALGKLNPDQGCLSGKTGNWPNFHLDQQQRSLIKAALKQYPIELTDEQKIEFTLKSLNCIACHQRGDFGGVAEARRHHFQTKDLNLGEQGRIPPTLTGVGAKLNPKWMRDVLVNGRSIRSYMKTRMPQYGEQNVGHLVKLFQSNDQLSDTDFAEFTDQKAMRKTGLKLAGNKGLNCVACHTYQYKKSDTMPAVDLTEMTDRLKKDWFYQYMLDPQKFSPNTVMPSFWPGGKAIRKDIEGDPEFQVEALWQYLIDGRQARAPSGVVREKLEIVVAGEAKMLRRSYPGIGKRGIGVGYAGGLNLAFDAEQMRLAMIWKGKFVDPVGVWTGQGSGNVRPLGKAINLAKGPELDDLSDPWIVDEGRPPNHQFKGYVLDDLRRPTFRYLFDTAVEVEDFLSEAIDESTGQNSLRRRVSLSTAIGRDNLVFRIAAADGITADRDGLFSIGEQMKIRIVSRHTAEVVDDGDGKQLRVLINLAAGEEQALVFEYLWEQQ